MLLIKKFIINRWFHICNSIYQFIPYLQFNLSPLFTLKLAYLHSLYTKYKYKQVTNKLFIDSEIFLLLLWLLLSICSSDFYEHCHVNHMVVCNLFYFFNIRIAERTWNWQLSNVFDLRSHSFVQSLYLFWF